MSFLTWCVVGLAGAVGAPMRYFVERTVRSRSGTLFPLGTFVVNMSGSLIFGFIAGLAIYHGFPNAPKVVLASGFCGAYTTFSTFTYETVRITSGHALRIAVAYVGSSVVVGWFMAAAGMGLASLHG